MQNIHPNTLTIIFGIIAAIGVAFGIYSHYSNRKFAKIIYEIKEFADFNLPSEFYQAVAKIPVSISIDNAGNINANNLLINLETKTKIENINVTANEEYDIRQSDNKVFLRFNNLNQADSINLLMYCMKNEEPTRSVMNGVKITITEGQIIDKKALSSRQAYKEIIDDVADSLPLGLGTIIKLTGKLTEPKSIN